MFKFYKPVIGPGIDRNALILGHKSRRSITRSVLKGTRLLVLTCAAIAMSISSASAALINFTFTEFVGGLDDGPSPATTLVWPAQFDLTTHPTQPFTTPGNVTTPFTALNLPTINWSGDTILSITDATVHDNSSGLTWAVNQGGGQPFQGAKFMCAQPCSDQATGTQQWGIVNANGFRNATAVDTWSGVGVASGVPEPGSLMLAMLGGMALVMKRYVRFARSGTFQLDRRCTNKRRPT